MYFKVFFWSFNTLLKLFLFYSASGGGFAEFAIFFLAKEKLQKVIIINKNKIDLYNIISI